MTGAVDAAADSRRITGRCSSLTKTSKAALPVSEMCLCVRACVCVFGGGGYQSYTLGTFWRIVLIRTEV